MFSPAARGEADEEDAEAPARVEGGASSSVANAGAEGAASTAGFSSSGAVAVSVTARRAVRNRVDLGTADVIGDEPETRRPRGTRTRGARDGAPAAAVGDATANILGRRGARRVWVRRECGPERVCRVRLRFVSKRRHAKRPEPRTGEIFDLERRSSLRKSLIVSWFPFVKSEKFVGVSGSFRNRVSTTGALSTPPRARFHAAMPRGSSKAKFYGVARGREPGVYSTWDEASAQVTGIKGAVHKSFGTEAEAEAWVAAQRGGDPGGDPRPSESARLRSPATSPIPPRARPSSSARRGAHQPSTRAEGDVHERGIREKCGKRRG